MQQNISFISTNGLRFGYYEMGNGPLILLLHGFPDTPHTWHDIQPQLATAGYRVVAPYMRGYSPTESPDNGDYSALQLGKDVLALITALGEKHAIVIGHDWGAFAAYAAANIDPTRLSKLVTIAIPHPATLQFNLRTLIKARHFITFQLRRWAVASLKRDYFAEINAIYHRWSPTWHVTDDELAPVKSTLAAPGGVENALGYYWSFQRDAVGPAGIEVRRVLQAKTQVPALACFGEADGALDQSNLDQTRRYFTSSYEMVRLAGVGHFLHREAPQPFLAKVQTFIKLGNT